MADSALASLRQIRTFTDIPLFRQFALIGALALAIAGGMALFTWTQKPAYVPVYQGLSEKDSSELADSLRSANIPYTIDPGTGAVTVPGDKIHEARLRAAAQGLPKGSATGYEMIQQDEGFGTSQFMESARYQLAMETELARTISSLQPVKAARVHLALPKPSPFTQGNLPASASVLVELQSGRELESNQVQSIQHVVASSVPNLAPGSVTVIDQFGRLLSGGDPNSPIEQSTEQYQYARRVEADYVRRIEQLLSPMLGAEHISAQVSADFDFSETEEAHESYNPQNSALRSEQTSEDMSRGGSTGPVGIPGATSNQPPAPAATPPAAATPANGAAPAPANGSAANAASATSATSTTDTTTSQSKSATRNYELDRTLSHTRHPVGRLRKLSVAVLVDNIAKADEKSKKTTMMPLPAEDLAKVETLVKQAVGFDEQRGDSVSVQNAPFRSDIVTPLPEEPIWKRAEFRDYLRQGIGAIVVLVLIFAVLRPLLKSLIAPRKPGPSRAVSGELNPVDAVGPDQLALSPAATPALALPAYEQKLTAARGAVAQDPKRVAQVVKTWVNEDGS